jgi:esterase/lipase superfamily enzyme
MNREYHKWYSPRLERDMELLVFGHMAGPRCWCFPPAAVGSTSMRTWEWLAALRHKIEQGQLQLYCVDSVDQESLYCFWAQSLGPDSPAPALRRLLCSTKCCR